MTGVRVTATEAGPTRYAIPVGTRVDALTAEQRARLFDRGRARDPEVGRAVADLIAAVRRHGDAALREQALRFDQVADLRIEVPRAEWTVCLEGLDPAVRAGLEQATANIAAFHRAQLPAALEVELQPGLVLGRRADALTRVGVYAPGGRAAYPSSVLMGVVPARVAGVREVVVCSPAGADGRPPASVLAAAAIGNADRVFAIGGAGAIAALAFGTDTVTQVEKVVGPGNAYVTEAKSQLNGIIATDCPAGPSEVLVLADDSADPELVAWELFAQAEHDPDAASVLASTSRALLDAVAGVIEAELPATPRSEIVAAALSARGALLLGESVDELLRFNEEYAPEHLALYLRGAEAVLPRARNAGTIFVGAHASVTFGDYLTGANHVLPTAGLARSYSGLSVLDFLRWTTYQRIGAGAAAALADPTACLAESEGLPAHARAARLRAKGGA